VHLSTFGARITPQQRVAAFVDCMAQVRVNGCFDSLDDEPIHLVVSRILPKTLGQQRGAHSSGGISAHRRRSTASTKSR